MTVVTFVSAVSDEFHHKDRLRSGSFESYREVLARSLRILVNDCEVVVQENLVQGMGDLLATLETEIRRCDFVVHIVGDMAGAVPEPASIRRMRERNPEWLTHEPELADSIGDGVGVSYTQWEAYLAFQHRRGRLIFQASNGAPRSPKFRSDDAELASQQRHWARLRETGEHYETCYDQLDLARKVVASVERHGLHPDAGATPAAEAVEAAHRDAGEIAVAIGRVLRESAKQAITEYDPAGIEAFLRAIDTATLQREIDRRTALQAVYHHREQLRESVAAEATPENLYDLAFAELALAHYPEAMVVAERLANEQIGLMQTDPDHAEQHRERALNAYLLLHEAAHLASRQDEAIAALERAGSLVDVEKEPVFWAEIHEPLAEYFLHHALFDRAEPLVDQIVDIREDHQGEDDLALPKSLLLWCRLLHARAKFQSVFDVAARAVRLIDQRTQVNPDALSTALSCQADALLSLGRNREAEPLMRRALAIDEVTHGSDHPSVATRLNSLASLLYATNRMTEAEQLFRRALAIDESTHGPEHPSVAIRLNNLAQLLQSTSRPNEAEPLMRRALSIDEAALGSGHPNVAIRLNNLAHLLQNTNRIEESEPLFRRALAIDEDALGSEHPNVATRLNNLASILISTNRLEEAEPLMRRALSIDEVALGPEHPKVATCLNNLSFLLQATNRVDEAAPLMRRHLQILLNFSASSGHEAPNLLDAISNYVALLQGMGRTEAQILKELFDLHPGNGLSAN